MNRELIEMIDAVIAGSDQRGADTNSPVYNLLRDCKAALSQEAEPFASYFESSGNEDEGVHSIRKIDFGVRGGAWKPLYKHPSILAPLPQPSASVPQDVEEFIDAHGYVAGEFDEVDLVVTVGSLRAWMAGHARVRVGKQKPYECFTIEGDTWFESPNDIELVHGRPLGEEFQLLAGWCAENVSYRVTKVPDEHGDDYEVELLTASKEPHNE